MRHALRVATCVALVSVGGSAQRASQPVEWPYYVGDQGGTKYSSLTQAPD